MNTYVNMLRLLAMVLIIGVILSGCRAPVSLNNCEDFHVIQRPILFDSTRARLSLEYMKTHYGIDQKQPTITPRMVIVHWTDIPTFEGTFNTFNPVYLPGARAKISSASRLNVPSQYVIDRDGTVYQLLPDTIFARHVIGLNHAAIGIENIGGKHMPLTKKQLQSNACLIQDLHRKYPIDYVLGHHEYTRFIGHPLWLERDPNYLTEKIDPGEKFMRYLNYVLRPLHLKDLPESKQKAHPTINEIPKS